jgi:hypothetical protein
MAIVVIGGQCSKIGKTSVVCALIEALPERRWTAIKMTQCKHDAAAGERCDCEIGNGAFAISEERDPTTGADSSRYLAAGAVRSLWVRTRPGRLAEAMPPIREEIGKSQNAILESNSALEFLQPDLYACVLDPEIADFKASALRYLDRADALLLPEGRTWQPRLSGFPFEAIERIPQFRIAPPSYCPAGFVSFVAQRLNGATEGSRDPGSRIQPA